MKRFASVALILSACPFIASAISTSLLITKESQSRFGLDFALSAIRQKSGSVLVHMTIPPKGKLKTLSKVRLHIREGKEILLLTPLATTKDKNGSTTAWFQVGPSLSDKCYIYLVTETSTPPEPFSEDGFHIQLKEYITDKQPTKAGRQSNH